MPSYPGSVPILGFIAPNDELDTYATQDSRFSRGGAHEVALLVDRDAITTDRRREGMLCYVAEDQTTYQLVGGILNANWVAFTGGALPSPIVARQILRGNEAGTAFVFDGNYSALVPPAVTDDFSAGYNYGSMWIDTVLGKVYVCVDPSVGSAVWSLLSPEGADIVRLSTTGVYVYSSIAAALAASLSGDIVYLPNKQYTSFSPLVVPNGVSVLGARSPQGKTTVNFTYAAPSNYGWRLGVGSELQSIKGTSALSSYAWFDHQAVLKDLNVSGGTAAPARAALQSDFTVAAFVLATVYIENVKAFTSSDYAVRITRSTALGVSANIRNLKMGSSRGIYIDDGVIVHSEDMSASYIAPETTQISQIPFAYVGLNCELECQGGFTQGANPSFQLGDSSAKVRLFDFDCRGNGTPPILAAPGIAATLFANGGYINIALINAPNAIIAIQQTDKTTGEQVLYKSTAAEALGNLLKLQTQSNGTVFSVDPNGKMEILGSARGDVLYRGASRWERLGAGTSGRVLTTQGLGADPIWGIAGGIQNNFTSVVDPVVGDDSSQGYAVGSRWVNTVLDKSYVCLDATIGAAIWRLESPTQNWVILVKGSSPRDTKDYPDVASAVAAASDEDAILLGPGSFPVTSQLNVPGNVSIVGTNGPHGKTTYLNLNIAVSPAVNMASGCLLRNLSMSNAVAATTVLQMDHSSRGQSIRVTGGDAAHPTMFMTSSSLGNTSAELKDVEAINQLGIGLLVESGSSPEHTVDLVDFRTSGMHGIRVGGGAVLRGGNLRTINNGVLGTFFDLGGSIGYVNGMHIKSCATGIKTTGGSCRFVGSDIVIQAASSQDIQMQGVPNGGELFIQSGFLDPTSLNIVPGSKYIIACINRESTKEAFCVSTSSTVSPVPFQVSVDALEAFSLDTAGRMEIQNSIPGDILYRGLDPGGRWDRLPAGIAGQLLQTNGIAAVPSWVNQGALIGALTAEPTGFPNRTDSQISFNSGLSTFTIQPTGASFDFYYNGTKFTKAAPDSIVLSTANGLHYIYYNSSGVLSELTTPWDLSQVVPVATVYWNNNITTGYLSEERHGLVMPWATHEYLHNAIHTRFVSGLGLSGVTLNDQNDVQFGVANGQIADEDINISIVHSAAPTNPFEQILAEPCQIPVWYRDGAGGVWRKKAATTHPVAYGFGGTNRVSWNQEIAGTWSEVAATANNYHVNYFMIATNNPSEPIIMVMGQAEYGTQALAEAALNPASLDLNGLATNEWKPLYGFVFRTNQTWPAPHAQIRSVADFRADAGLPGTQYIATDHGALAGLLDDDHPQYFNENVPNEFNSLTLKEPPGTADVIVFEDATGAVYDKKRGRLGSILHSTWEGKLLDDHPQYSGVKVTSFALNKDSGEAYVKHGTTTPLQVSIIPFIAQAAPSGSSRSYWPIVRAFAVAANGTANANLVVELIDLNNGSVSVGSALYDPIVAGQAYLIPFTLVPANLPIVDTLLGLRIYRGSDNAGEVRLWSIIIEQAMV